MKIVENQQSYILKDSSNMEYYTNLAKIFDALEGKQNDYNWLITDIELNHCPINILNSKKIWISGEELSRIVYQNDIQFIWAVLSGFKKDIKIDINNLDIEPYANGNNGFWIANPQIQHPLATVEMVCWDSSLFLLLSKDNELSERFSKRFQTAKNLIKYNLD